MKIMILKDDRLLGFQAFEIESFPAGRGFGKELADEVEKLSALFERLLNESHKLFGNMSCMELFWVAEKVQNQAFSARIRIFLTFRKIGMSRKQVETELNNVSSNMLSTLGAMQFNIQEIDDDQFAQVLESVNDQNLFGVVKSERCISNSNSLYPYYYSEVIPAKNTDNFNGLISILSEIGDCCVCFQIFPDQLTAQECFMFNEITAELGQFVSGVNLNGMMYKDPAAAEPASFYKYYNERSGSPVFLYNILTFGNRSACLSIATKLISLLQAGTDSLMNVNFACIDLTQERISLKKQYTFYPWNINRRLQNYYRNQKLRAALPLVSKLPRLPYLITAQEASSFYRLPIYEKTMSSLKSNQILKAQEQFSGSVVDPDNIRFGELISNDSNKIMIGCPPKAFTKHGLIVGTPGSGKTTFAVYLLLQFAKKGIPFLAIEPTKSEYRAMIEAIPDLQIFTPGNNAVSPYICNPFIPPAGIRIEQYIPSLASAFKAAFSMPSPLDMVFLRAIRASYTQYGWKDYSKAGDPDVTVFGLHEFICVFKDLMKTFDYSNEVRGNIESAGILRLTNLIEQNSNIYDSISTVPIEDLLKHPTVLELNSIDNEEQKSLIMALLLINICVYTKHNQAGDGKLKNVILIDEAHVLLGGSVHSGENAAESKGTAVKALQDMIAEIRSYGTSILIADQSPTKVSREVVANTDIKVSFRLVQSAEKEMIADSTNMDDMSRDHLSRLKPGQAYFYFSQLESPQLIYTPDIREREGIRLSVSDQEVSERSTYWDSHQELLIPYRECRFCSLCRKTCDFTVRSNAEYIAGKTMSKYKEKIRSDDDLKLVVFNLPKVMRNDLDSCTGLDQKKLAVCSRIKFYRKAMLGSSYRLDDRTLERVINLFPKSM